MLTRLKSLTLVDQATAQLLEFIDEQKLQAGDSLPSIAQLSETFGASRAVIRECLKSLEAQGIIEICNGKRAAIKPVTSEPLFNYFQRFLKVDKNAVWEFIEIRAALEFQCISLAIARASEEELNEVKNIVSEMRENIDAPQIFAELDVKFHLLIARASHNQTMMHLVESLRGAICESIRLGLEKSLTPEAMEQVQQNHEKLIAAMIERNEPEASRALNAHFDELVITPKPSLVD